MPVRYPQVVRWTRAFWDNRRERRSPLLGKGGVAAPSSKWSRSFAGAAGVVRSTSDNRWLEPTTPSTPAKEASRHFLNGRSHPSLSKEGTSAFPPVVFNAPVSSKKMWDMARHHCKVGNNALSQLIHSFGVVAHGDWIIGYRSLRSPEFMRSSSQGNP